MKFPSLNSISPLEIVLFVIFLLYLIFPIPTPPVFMPYVNSNIGMVVVILLTLYMVFYTTPVLGILTIFVAYELLRRSSVDQPKRKIPFVRHTPNQPKKDKEIVKMNPAKELSLEEQTINEMSPIGKGATPDGYVDSDFKPVNSKILGGSLL